MAFRFLGLTIALAAALTAPAVAAAQDRGFDDRWYITAGSGANFQDSHRGTENVPTATLGVGKFINPRWSFDAELNYQNPAFSGNRDLNWSQYGVSLDARRHFRANGRRWNPYLLAGVGYQRADEEYDNFPNPNSPGHRRDGFASVKLGAGLQGDFKHVSVRTELYARTDFDRDSVRSPGSNRFTDAVAAVSLVVPLGRRDVAEASPAPPPVPVQVVTVPEPEYVAPEAPMVIELPSVYFDFNSAQLRAEGRQALEAAAATLRDNPGARVQVSGHTDSKGGFRYNQVLSERRAQAAYAYLVGQGVDPAQLLGPVGYGESRPAAPNTHADGTDNPEGRAQNRRTDLDPVD